jgi:hypothetical protein
MSTSSCPYSPLSEEEKVQLRASREDQLRDTFRDAIVGDLLSIYVAPAPGGNPVEELFAGLDAALGLDRRRVFLEVLKEAVKTMEDLVNGGNNEDSIP